MRVRTSGVSTSRCALAFSLLLLLVVGGCAPATPHKATVAPDPNRGATTQLGPLRVTARLVAAPYTEFIDHGGASVGSSRPAASGKSPYTLIATAVNPSDATLSVYIKHNFPWLTDAGGASIEATGIGELGVRNAANQYYDSRFSITPGSTIRAVLAYEFASRPRGLVLKWHFSEFGTATVAVP